jgi:hypothetical protein
MPAFAWLNVDVLTKQTAAEFVESLELERLPACPMCLFDLAWAMHEGRSVTGLLRRTISWVWPEIEEAVHVIVARARMRELPHAEAALRDLRSNGSRGLLAREIIMGLARRLAAEFGRVDQPS